MGAHKRELDFLYKSLDIINSLSRSLNKTSDLSSICETALDLIMGLGFVEMTGIYMVNKESKEAILKASRNIPESFTRAAARIPYPKGVTWKVILSQDLLYVKNAENDPDVGPAGRELGFRSMLGIPIMIDREAIGVIWLLSFQERIFSKSEQKLLVSIGTQVAVSIAKADLYSELLKKTRYEKIINSVSSSVHETIKLQDVLENAAWSMKLNIGAADRVAIYFIEGKQAVLKAQQGYPDWIIDSIKNIPYPEGYTWQTILDGKPRHNSHLNQNDSSSSFEKGLQTGSFVSMPVYYENQVLGCVNVSSCRRNAFYEDELKLLKKVAQQIEIAINNAKRAEALTQSEGRYRALFTQSPVGVYVFDNSLTIIDCNEHIAQILNSSTEKIKGLNIRKLEDSSFKGIHEQAIFEGRVCQREGFYKSTTSSKQLWLSVRVSPLSDADENMVAGIAVVEDITDRREFQQKLRFQSNLLDSVRESVIATDLVGKVIYWGKGAESLYGYSEDEMIGKSITMLVDSQKVQQEKERINQVIETGLWEGEYVQKRKDGSYFWANTCISLVKDDQGEPFALIGIDRDISERRRAEEATRKSKREYENLFHNIHTGVYRTTPDGSILMANSALIKMLGYSSFDELASRNLEDEGFTSDCPRSEFKEILEREGEVEGLESVWTRNDGTEIIVRENARALCDEDGTILYYEGTVEDITERKQIEEALRESEEKFRTLVEHTFDLIAEVSNKGRFIFVSPKHEDVLGYAPVDLVGKSIFDPIHPDDRASAISAFSKALSTSSSGQATHRFKHKNGDWRWLESTGKFYRTAEGELRAVVASRDITERKRMEEKMKQYAESLRGLSQRLIEIQETERRKLAFELHDEVGQVLTAVKLNLEALRTLSEDSSFTPRLQLSIESVENAIQRVRDVSLNLRPSILDDLGLVPAIRWYLNRLSKTVNCEFEFSTNVSPEKRFSFNVETTVFRVAQEALTNIVRHSRAQNAYLSLNKSGPGLNLTVKDDGIGFDVKAAREESVKGNSFGLFGMEERVALSGGEIDINSKRIKGTIVTVDLPLNQ